MELLSLHFLHEQSGARFLEVGGREVVAHSGDEQGEYQAAREACALHDASYRESLRLVGEDRVEFLHGMVTQDVKKLGVGSAAYAALVNVKGAMVADARILRREQELVLDLEPGTAGRVKEFLEKYLVSEDVEVREATGELGLLRLLGPQTSKVLEAALGAMWEPLAEGAMREVELGGVPVWAVGSPRVERHGVDLVVPRGQLEAVWRALVAAGEGHGLRPLGWQALEVLRVEAGVPRYGQDLVETTIPLEAELTHAISYDKGCYIGQEVIARATFRGHMNRKLRGLLLGEAEVAPGTELRVGEKKVGWVTSVVRSPVKGQWVALGYVHRDHLDPGTELVVGSGPAKATVAALPLG
jgi:folate-binding protein YgfZ